jgi:hypothetical protein
VRWTPKRTRFVLTVVALLLAATVGYQLTFGDRYGVFGRGEMLRASIQMANLAELPAGAKNIEVATFGSMFTRTFTVKFEGTSDEIEAFINGSPAFTGQQPVPLGGDTLHLPYSMYKNLEMEDPVTRIYFHPFNSAPWFSPLIDRGGKGRRYKIPPFEKHNGGYLIIDDVTHTVYYYIAHS